MALWRRIRLCNSRTLKLRLHLARFQSLLVNNVFLGSHDHPDRHFVAVRFFFVVFISLREQILFVCLIVSSLSLFINVLEQDFACFRGLCEVKLIGSFRGVGGRYDCFLG